MRTTPEATRSSRTRPSRRPPAPLLAALLLVLSALLALRPEPTIGRSAPVAVRTPEAPSPVRHVILISVDGLRPDAVTRQSAEELPNFHRLRAEGAFTDNARTDVDFSNTLPNHTAQLTGRPVTGEDGHHWTGNRDPEPGTTLHSNKGSYVASVFDVAHDHGLTTGAYVSKSKFSLFDESYDERNGAPDLTGADDGRDKIDAFVFDDDTEDLVDRFVRDMQADPYGLAFVHLRDPDSHGHTRGWRLRKGSAYMKSVRHVDEQLGKILHLVDTDPRLRGNTVVILTADHGGGGPMLSHGDASDEENYTIPFYVWGAGVPKADLYALNAGLRQDPGEGRPGFDAPLQPIRNGGAGNLALSILGLPAIGGSMIETAALRVRPVDMAGEAPPAGAAPSVR